MTTTTAVRTQHYFVLTHHVADSSDYREPIYFRMHAGYHECTQLSREMAEAQSEGEGAPAQFHDTEDSARTAARAHLPSRPITIDRAAVPLNVNDIGTDAPIGVASYPTNWGTQSGFIDAAEELGLSLGSISTQEGKMLANCYAIVGREVSL